MLSSREEELQQAIVDLYLNVKIRSTDEIAKMTDSKMDEEREQLDKMDPMEVIDYIRQSVEILMNMKSEEYETYKQALKDRQSLISKLTNEKEDDISAEMFDIKLHHKSRPQPEPGRNRFILTSGGSMSSTQQQQREIPEDYEKMIQKLENDIRSHIRVEQQLKLHIESLNFQADESEKRNQIKIEELESNISQIQAKLHDKDRTIYQLRAELNEKEKPLKEKQAAIKAMEAKIVAIEERHEKEMDQVKKELQAYRQSEVELVNRNKIQSLQLDLHQMTHTDHQREPQKQAQSTLNQWSVGESITSKKPQDTLRSTSQHQTTSTPLDAYSIRNIIRQGTSKKDNSTKTPAANSQHFDLSNLEFYTTNSNNAHGATDHDTESKRKKNYTIEKSKLIQSSIMRGQSSSMTRRCKSNNSPNPSQADIQRMKQGLNQIDSIADPTSYQSAAAPVNNKIIINQQQYKIRLFGVQNQQNAQQEEYYGSTVNDGVKIYDQAQPFVGQMQPKTIESSKKHKKILDERAGNSSNKRYLSAKRSAHSSIQHQADSKTSSISNKNPFKSARGSYANSQVGTPSKFGANRAQSQFRIPTTQGVPMANNASSKQQMSTQQKIQLIQQIQNGSQGSSVPNFRRKNSSQTPMRGNLSRGGSGSSKQFFQ